MGIQQKLHTKLVQKLILTPSLQQAIKLLPMSTLELSDLLNQRWWRTDARRGSHGGLAARGSRDGAGEDGHGREGQQDRDVGRQDYEYFFGDYMDDGYRPRAQQEIKELPPIENTLSTRARSPII